MTAKVVMVQGTGSSVGKSVIAAGLCRIFAQDGYRVAPFKAQNMSNNSFVCPGGGEIGRAQAVQAESAGVEPAVEMNPVLLKPEGDGRSQVVVLGRADGRLTAANFYDRKRELWSVITQCLEEIMKTYDVVVIEGAGSPVEINLKRGDIVNMKVARHAKAPVLLVGDIDRGGIFASLLGTLDLFDPDERALIAGLVVNKFRGDMSLFRSGVEMLEERAGAPVLGVIPYRELVIPEEDAVALDGPRPPADRSDVDIAVIRLPRISNFDDFGPLEREPGISLRYVSRIEEMGRPDLVIIPGTKTTMADLGFLRDTGLADAIVRHREAEGKIIGICGGFQMLGSEILDPELTESDVATARGLRLLDVITTFVSSKETSQVRAEFASGPGLLAGLAGVEIDAYEIHMGRTQTRGRNFLYMRRANRPDPQADGAVSEDGRVIGTYVHGLFDDQRVRTALRSWLGGKALAGGIHSRDFRQRQYDGLAELLRESLDMGKIEAVMGF